MEWEPRAWAWAGYNLLTLDAPSLADLEAYGPSAAAVGAVLDSGYAFGFFAALEPHANASALTPHAVAQINGAYRCHGRWATPAPQAGARYEQATCDLHALVLSLPHQ